MVMSSPQSEFGVVVTGNELLCGKRSDRHLPHVIDTLYARGQTVAWCIIVGDDTKRLVRTLRETRREGLPVFCFGGIGATPDDRTRQAAAGAFNIHLERNFEALSLIELQFGEQAYPNRVRMAELPEDSVLIPNPVNRVPGFTLGDYHFLPGFPQMAWPMMEWVLERYYPPPGEVFKERSVRLADVPESELLDLMDQLAQRHAAADLFSLPRLGKDCSVEVGFRGRRAPVDAAFDELLAELRARSLAFEMLPDRAH